MENSKRPERGAALSSARRRLRRFAPEALASILREDLRITPDTECFVAYSGGMDSHVLLHALAALRASEPWRISALHVDHSLQPKSAEWAEHCAQVCTDLVVPYRATRVSVRHVADHGLEDAARRARYAALAEMLPPDGVLLTAHHRNDQAETLMLQLLRGSGVAGLAAMPTIAPFANGRLARPLLGFERAALADYARTHGLHWIEDASNFDTGRARNFLRHRIWPVLSERWPASVDRVATAAGHAAETSRLLDDLAQLDRDATADEEGKLRIPILMALSPERQGNLLRFWIREETGASPPEKRLRELMRQILTVSRTQHASVTWGSVTVRRYRDCLSLHRASSGVDKNWEALWDPATVLEIPGANWRLRAQPTAGSGLARERIAGSALRVCFRQGGEQLLFRGHHRSLKKLFQEAGVPPWERRIIPLIYLDGELIAVGDRWVSDSFAAAPDAAGLALTIDRE